MVLDDGPHGPTKRPAAEPEQPNQQFGQLWGKRETAMEYSSRESCAKHGEDGKRQSEVEELAPQIEEHPRGHHKR